ncbi:MAG: hypothetical protein OXC11_06235 [Rhodospirillales bacterium]|nr:hypothetical protein [Rhodospirillales bacterium]
MFSPLRLVGFALLAVACVLVPTSGATHEHTADGNPPSEHGHECTLCCLVEHSVSTAHRALSVRPVLRRVSRDAALGSRVTTHRIAIHRSPSRGPPA